MKEVKQLGFEGNDWHIETEEPEQFYVFCSVCSFDIPRTLSRERAILVAKGHESMTGHQVLIQGEDHHDTELI